MKSAADRPLFAWLRLVALAFVLVWIPTYTAVWGWRNFLQLCDVTVLLTAVALWRGDPLLLSAEATGSLVINTLWGLDAGTRLFTGHHLLGGTEYMWDAQYALPVRLLSLFHVALPPLHLACLRRTGYDARAFKLQCAIVAVVMLAARVIGGAEKNINYTFSAPLLHRPLGPAPVHMAIIYGFCTLLMMWPVHRLLRAVMPARPGSARLTRGAR